MGLEVGLFEALTGATGQHPRAVGVQPEERGDLARRLVLDLGVPQHGLPALRQRQEGPHGHGLLGLVHRAHIGPEVQTRSEGAEGRGVGGRFGGSRRLGGEHREVVDQLLPLGGLRPARGHAPDGGEQIGAYGLLGAVAAAHRLEHPGEDLGREVVGGVGVAAAGAGIPAHRARVAPVQLLVGGVVAGAHPHDQLGVGRGQIPGRRQYAVLPAIALCRDSALDGLDRFAALLRDDGLGAAAAPRDARPSSLTRHLRRTAGLRVAVARRLVPPVKAHRGKPPLPAQPVPNTGSECHIGFCSGPRSADHPLVRGDLSCGSTSHRSFGEGSITAHRTEVEPRAGNVPRIPGFRCIPGVRRVPGASRLTPGARRAAPTPHDGGRSARGHGPLRPAASATPPAGCPAAVPRPPPAVPRPEARAPPSR